MNRSRIPAWLWHGTKFLFGDAGFNRWARPTFADYLVEQEGQSSRPFRSLSLLGQLLNVLVYASALEWRDRVRDTHMWPMIAALLAGIVGAIGMQGVSVRHSQLHLCFVALGLIVAALVATAPKPLARAGSAVLLPLAALSILLVPWVGISYDGVRRWIAVGPLQVHVAVLILPLYVTALWRVSKAAPWRLLPPFLVLLVLLVLQPDIGSVLVYALVSLFVAQGWVRVPVAIGGVTAVVAVLMRSPAPVAIPLVEGSMQLVAARGAGWLGIAVAAWGTVIASVGVLVRVHGVAGRSLGEGRRWSAATMVSSRKASG